MLRFSEITGHETVKENLHHAIQMNKVSHAYIITGEELMGRKSLAGAFVLELFCEQGADAQGRKGGLQFRMPGGHRREALQREHGEAPGRGAGGASGI